MDEPLTIAEESFLRAWLQESNAGWISGDMFRAWMQKMFASIQTERQDATAVREIAAGLAERVAAQSKLLSRRAEKHG